MMNLTGTGVALITPFKADQTIDEQSLRRLTDYVISGGVDFLVALGTTSESATLSADEKHRVMEIIIDQNNGRLPLVAGIGGNYTAAVAESIIRFPYLSECQAILSVTPYYNKPSQEGLYRHYKEIAECAPLPVLLYNVPGRTAVNLTAETTVRLSHDVKNIMGIKEASGDLQQMTEIMRDMRPDFIVFSGDDGITLPILSMGGHGVISVIANLFPAEFSAMVCAARQGAFEKAREIHQQLSVFYRILFKEGNPTGVKAALHIRKIIEENVLRLPLVATSRGLYAELSEKLKVM